MCAHAPCKRPGAGAPLGLSAGQPAGMGGEGEEGVSGEAKTKKPSRNVNRIRALKLTALEQQLADLQQQVRLALGQEGGRHRCMSGLSCWEHSLCGGVQATKGQQRVWLPSGIRHSSCSMPVALLLTCGAAQSLSRTVDAGHPCQCLPAGCLLGMGAWELSMQ